MANVVDCTRVHAFKSPDRLFLSIFTLAELCVHIGCLARASYALDVIKYRTLPTTSWFLQNAQECENLIGGAIASVSLSLLMMIVVWPYFVHGFLLSWVGERVDAIAGGLVNPLKIILAPTPGKHGWCMFFIHTCGHALADIGLILNTLSCVLFSAASWLLDQELQEPKVSFGSWPLAAENARDAVNDAFGLSVAALSLKLVMRLFAHAWLVQLNEMKDRLTHVRDEALGLRRIVDGIAQT